MPNSRLIQNLTQRDHQGLKITLVLSTIKMGPSQRAQVPLGVFLPHIQKKNFSKLVLDVHDFLRNLLAISNPRCLSGVVIIGLSSSILWCEQEHTASVTLNSSHANWHMDTGGTLWDASESTKWHKPTSSWEIRWIDVHQVLFQVG